MLKSKIFLVSLLMLFMTACFEDCDNPTTPEIPEETAGEFEILYEQILPIINAFAPDLTNGAASIWGNGGKNSSYWVSVGDNKWTATVWLEFRNRPYYIWVNDYKVSNDPVAEKLSMRQKGESNWTELICIETNGLDPDGKWVKLLATKLGIQNPCGGQSSY